MTDFHASRVVVQDMDEEGYFLVGFADDDYTPQNCLLLQRGYEDTEQDRRLGMATYYVELNDQGHACYGGISRFALRRDHAFVEFDERGRKELDCEATLQITFSIDDAEFRALAVQVARVFVNEKCFSNHG